jgi:transcriptional regulator GlxA family with amidase domain
LSHVKLSVAFILLPEFTLTAFSGFVDSLRLAADDADKGRQIECNWTILAPDLNPIRSNCGVEVTPLERFEAAGEYDYLIIVGGQVEPQRHTNPIILDFIKKAADDGQSIVSACTATFVLARIGVMDGYKCCVHFYHRPEFEEEFPEIEVVSDTIFSQDQNRITSPGGTSSFDVALSLLEKHCGPSSARKVASGMVIECIRNYQTPQPHQETSWFGEIPNPFIRRVILVMDKYITAPLSMKDIASKLNISENSLYRKFDEVVGVSPAKLLRALRLAHGHRSLHKTNMSISQIAQNYQFSDSSHFTRLHTQFFGTSPAKTRAMGREECVKKIIKIGHKKIIRQILLGDLFILSEGDKGF